MLVVANTNVVIPSYARKFLIGLSIQSDVPLGIVPRLRKEIPDSLSFELESREDQRRSRLGKSMPPDSLAQCERIARDWLETVLQIPRSPLRHCATSDDEIQAARDLLKDEALRTAFMEKDANRQGRDELVVAQSIAGRAQVIFTKNMNSILHHNLNQWALDRLGLNNPIIQLPNAWTQRMYTTEDSVQILTALFAMSVSDNPRSFSEESESAQHFLAYAGTVFDHATTIASQAMFNASLCRGCLEAAIKLKETEPWRSVREQEKRMANRVRNMRAGSPSVTC